MKILFVAPPQYNIYGKNMPPVYPPLGLLSLASVLRKAGHEVGILDLDAERIGDEEFLLRVKNFSADMLGITCTTPTVDAAFEICKKVKSAFPEVFTVLGGIHPTVAPEKTLEEPSVDAICVGEGEYTVVELINALQAKRDLNEVPGLGIRVNGEPYLTPPRGLESDLDTFPLPAYDLVDCKRYSPPYAVSLPVAPIMSSRGCPGRCTYCCSKLIFGRRFRARSVDSIVSEIETLVKDHGVREVHFLDDNISTNKKRLLKLCARLREKDFPVNYQIPPASGPTRSATKRSRR